MRSQDKCNQKTRKKKKKENRRTPKIRWSCSFEVKSWKSGSRRIQNPAEDARDYKKDNQWLCRDQEILSATDFSVPLPFLRQSYLCYDEQMRISPIFNFWPKYDRQKTQGPTPASLGTHKHDQPVIEK